MLHFESGLDHLHFLIAESLTVICWIAFRISVYLIEGYMSLISRFVSVESSTFNLSFSRSHFRWVDWTNCTVLASKIALMAFYTSFA